MTAANNNLEITLPKNQIELFGYEYFFNSFIALYQRNKLPNTILLSGSKGSGKATFAYHFINYIFSFKEKNKYSLNNFTINPDNNSYINLCKETHPNFFLLENSTGNEDIKIENVRNALQFLSKSTYSSNIKIVLIDSLDCLNVYSSNALLKVLEETNNKTFFFLINNNPHKILNTIKSRSIEFKFFFTLSEKKEILENIIRQYGDDFDVNVAFETMNNRGKSLSHLERLKNRLIYLTTLYEVKELDEDDRLALRDIINDTWKKVYHELGRNKKSPLNDDDFLKAHWTIYFRYTRKQGNAYVSFLLDQQFNPKNIYA